MAFIAPGGSQEPRCIDGINLPEHDKHLLLASARSYPTIEARRGTRRTRPRGFTLVEALSALLLVAVVLPFVIRGVSLSARGAADQERQATAVELAQIKMDEAVLTEAWTFGDAEGEFDATYGEDTGRYNWRITVSDWINTRYKTLEVTVWWERGAKVESVRLQTVVNVDA